MLLCMRASPHLAWVTGASGFLGGEIARYFAAESWSVVAFARQLQPERSFEHPAIRWSVGAFDRCRLEAEIAQGGAPDVVFHSIGSGSVAVAQADPLADFHSVLASLATVLDVIRRKSRSTILLYPSSAAVYGAATATPQREFDPPNPVSVYGWHKLGAETLLRSAASLDGITAYAVRLFSLYGPGLRKQIMWDLGRRLLSGEPVVTLSGSGNELRDFLHVRDACGLFHHLAHRAASKGFSLINGGTGTATRIADLAQMLKDATGATSQIVFNGSLRQGDPQSYRACMREALSLGFQPKITLERGVAEYIEWLKGIDPG
jgi:UDP-glucose 4-epimerase